MLRRFCNLAYATLREGRSDDQVADLDLLLAEGPDMLHERQSRDAQRRLVATMGIQVPPA